MSKANRFRLLLAGSMCCPSGRLPDIFNVLQYLPATGIVRSELSKANRFRRLFAGGMCYRSGRLRDIFNVLQFKTLLSLTAFLAAVFLAPGAGWCQDEEISDPIEPVNRGIFWFN
ncbi:MAG: hypothetical protein KDD60_13280, partial [Bdellovibrionales bacterium]|nr:hypothetical protein [Bdellovibrionales bacterium]